MEVVMLENDGRCVWLENKVLRGFMPMAIRNSVNPFAKKLYVIVDWISNDFGKVGVDLKWFRSLGVPAVATAKDLPNTQELKVVNTGYDSIVDQEIILRDRGVEIIDKPCPFIRRVRSILEEKDSNHQYVLLCEPNHIIVKNFASLFPADLLLVQMENYQQKIKEGSNGKPMRLIPYVTFLQSDAQEVMAFIQEYSPHIQNESIQTACIWVKSKASPIVEIDQLSEEKLQGIQHAVLISTAGTTNKSVISMEKSLHRKGLTVHSIGSFRQFLQFERLHKNQRILLVRSPIPNQAEKPIVAYIQRGLWAAIMADLSQKIWVKSLGISFWKLYLAIYYRLFPQKAFAEAAENGLLKTQFQTAEAQVKYFQPKLQK
jgi:hypothetical protein